MTAVPAAHRQRKNRACRFVPAWAWPAVFALACACAADAQLTRGPYLQNGSSSEITVRWRTSTPSRSYLHFGPSVSNQGGTVFSDGLTSEHELTVTGLPADSKFYYTISDGLGPLAGGDAQHFFHTAPISGADKPVRIWVIGDCGTGGNGTGQAEAVRDAYLNSPLFKHNDVWLLLGDNAYDTGRDEEYQKAIFETYQTLLPNTVLWSALGNHETYGPDIPYFDIFTFPRNAQAGGVASGTEHYFSFDHGPVHFICLDSMISSRLPGSPMLTWLEEDLASTIQKWIIAFWHHPPYTKGSHDSDWEHELVQIREHVLPILETGGVDLVLGGHSHSYERSFLIHGHYGFSNTLTAEMIKDNGDGRDDGTGPYGKDPEPQAGAVYVVAGNAGKISGGALNHPVMFTSQNVLGSLILDVDGERLRARHLADTGAVTDEFVISKAPLVTVSASPARAHEEGRRAAFVTFARSRGLEAPLSVQLSIGGTATRGLDYENVFSPVVIPAGATSAILPIRPISDHVAEGPETVLIRAATGERYRVRQGSSNATVIIEDTPLDDWRFRKFGGEANVAAIAGDDADPDGDGQNNVSEYAAATNPRESTSVFTATIKPGGSGQPVVRFTAQPDRRYTIVFKNALTDAEWQRLTDVEPASELREIAFTDITIGPRGQRFYRVVTAAP